MDTAGKPEVNKQDANSIQMKCLEQYVQNDQVGQGEKLKGELHSGCERKSEWGINGKILNCF